MALDAWNLWCLSTGTLALLIFKVFIVRIKIIWFKLVFFVSIPLWLWTGKVMSLDAIEVFQLFFVLLTFAIRLDDDIGAFICRDFWKFKSPLTFWDTAASWLRAGFRIKHQITVCAFFYPSCVQTTLLQWLELAMIKLLYVPTTFVAVNVRLK